MQPRQHRPLHRLQPIADQARENRGVALAHLPQHVAELVIEPVSLLRHSARVASLSAGSAFSAAMVPPKRMRPFSMM